MTRHCTARLGWLSVVMIPTVLAIVLAAQTSVPPRAPVAPTSAEIAGRVGGVVLDAQTRRPVPFATVQLAAMPGAPMATRENVVSRDDGTFEIVNVSAGRYILAAFKPGHPPVFYRQSGPSSFVSGDPVSVAAGQQLDGLELGLVRGGVIAGRVVDPDGEPAVGAKVTLHPSADRSRNLSVYFPSPFEMFYTNVRGEYRLWGLAPGDYLVAVSAGPSAGAAYRPTWFPGVSDAGRAQRITLSAGQVLDGIDFNLASVKPVDISGTVVGADNVQPWEMEVIVRGQDLSAPNLVWVGGSVDATRHFSIKNVPPGDYWLRASRRPSYGQTDSGEPAWALLQVSVTDSSIRDLVLTMQPWLTASGIVRVETSMPGMEPSRLKIRLFASQDSLFGPNVTDLAVQRSGAFSAPTLRPGRYALELSAAAPGAVVTVRALEVGGRPSETDAITLAPGESLSDIVIVADVRPYVAG